MTLAPLHDRILVEPAAPVERTAGGIELPDIYQDGDSGPPVEGTVLAAGPGFLDKRGVLHAMTLKPGDRVLFEKFIGTDVVVDGRELVVMHETDVLGVVS